VKEWVSKTNALGIIAKAGRYGGNYAHMNLPQPDRLTKLNAIAIRQMKTLTSAHQLKLPE